MPEIRGYNPEDEEEDKKKKMTVGQTAKSVGAGVLAGLAAISAVEKVAPHLGAHAEDNENRAEASADDEDRVQFESKVNEYESLLGRGRQRQAEVESAPEKPTLNFEEMGLDRDQLYDFPWKDHEIPDGELTMDPKEVDSMTWTAIESQGLEDLFDQAIEDLEYEMNPDNVHVYFKEGSEFYDDENDLEMTFWIEDTTDEDGNVTGKRMMSTAGSYKVAILKSGSEGFDPDEAQTAVRQAVQYNLVPHLALMKK